jgi:hypothetical protein
MAKPNPFAKKGTPAAGKGATPPVPPKKGNPFGKKTSKGK